MKIGIMQPYLFPYISYFQLINAVDKFVIYDDVQFIGRGWINRNRLLINGEDNLFTMKIKKDNSRININERFLVNDFECENSKILRTIKLAYSKAPYFNNTFNIINNILNYKEQNLSKFITNSIIKICEYLDVNTEIIVSSALKKDTTLKSQEKIIHINKILGANYYINPIGGMELYSKEIFEKKGIGLYFIKTNNITYNQFRKDKFISNLSIIDVLMFNSKEKVKELLNEYELV